jgi:hypothetical protein
MYYILRHCDALSHYESVRFLDRYLKKEGIDMSTDKSSLPGSHGLTSKIPSGQGYAFFQPKPDHF